MILFEEDFVKQGAYIHHNTKNASFIKMHVLLKKMGIKNNAFFLAIHNKELMHVDPFDISSITPELAMDIAYELKINPWYGIRELLRIPVKGASDPISFILNRANLATTWCLFNNINVYLTQSRQTGKTVSVIAVFVIILYFVAYNYKAAMLAKDNKLRSENVSRLKDIVDCLPKYLLSTSYHDADNKQSVEYGARKTAYDSWVARSSEADADALGRGMSYSLIHLDETEYFKNIRHTYSPLSNAMNAAGAQAIMHGLPSAKILTSTAGKLEEDATIYCLELIEKSLTFTETLYDILNRDELLKVVAAGSTNNMIHCNYSYLQLGYTNAWLRKVAADSNSTQAEIERDYLNIRKAGTTASVLPQDLVDGLVNSIKQPVMNEITKAGYMNNWYVHPQELQRNRIPLVIGVDTSENVGSDFTEVIVINAMDMSVVFTARCNESSLILLGKYIAQMLMEYENSILVPERKSSGSLFVSIIATELKNKGINPFTRIFNQIIQQVASPPFDQHYKEIMRDPSSFEGILKKYLGFPTGGSGEYSRNALYKNTLMKAVKSNLTRMYDDRLVKQLISLRTRNGRIDHGVDGHDDAVIAWLLCCWFIYYGQNIQYYNIDTSKYLSNVTDSGDDIDPEYKLKQQEFKEKLDRLRREYTRSFDPTTRSFLRTQIIKYEKYIDRDLIDDTPISIEQHKHEVRVSPGSIERIFKIL